MFGALMQRAKDWVDLQQTELVKGMRRAAPYARGRLLDVGCGAKPYADIFAPYVDEYVGVEYEETFNATVHISKHAADVTYSGDKLPFADESFETVLCSQVLEHVPRPAHFFSDLLRVLKSGGHLILTAPFSFRHHAEPYDYHRFTRHGLAEYARSANLEIELLEPQGGFWTVIGHKLNCYAVFNVARLGRDVQAAGGAGHESPMTERPRYWTLPGVATTVVGVTLATKLLDRFDASREETLGFLLVARKSTNSV